MDIRALKAFLAGPMQEVSALLEASLRSDIALLDATNRSLLSQGGKLMRPMLSLLSAGACGGINADSVRFAAAAEMIHNATLLHDDVVDGATMRRGKPTVMSILSSPASVLVGDYWLVKAIRCILDADRYSERAIRLFAKTLSDLAEGEMLQLQKASNGDTTREDYLRIIYSKTASLFEASVLSVRRRLRRRAGGMDRRPRRLRPEPGHRVPDEGRHPGLCRGSGPGEARGD